MTPVFHPVRECPACFHDTMVYFPVYEVYEVERGNRPGSLDTLLCKQCLDLGVDFEFSSPLREEDIPGLKPGTIIACGLIPEAYRMVGVPFLQVYMWISRGEAPCAD
ncbi:MAG: hypothetical protein SWK76_16385 [Actinomycetota bacterium]|nr:hypothetical protein [Actinomycetota bacterium]